MHIYDLHVVIQADITVRAETEEMAQQIAEESIYMITEPDVVASLAQRNGWPENVRVVEVDTTHGVDVENIEQIDMDEEE